MERVLTIMAVAMGLFALGFSTSVGAQTRAAETKPLQLAQLIFCVPPKVWSKKRQRCVNPFVRKRVRCKAPRVWSSRQRRCVFPVVADPRCGPREVWSKETEVCVCRDGYEARDGACVRLAGDASQPDYAEVQRCLNQLGYNAGRVDGQPGQRTRRAMRSFRADVGLNNRPSRLNDPVTLERLFKECDEEKPGSEQASEAPAAEDAEPKTAATQDEPAPEPKPDPQPQQSADPGAGQGAYPDLLCVSKGLRKALSRVAGGKLAVCGEACVPIPQGMSEKQLKQSEQEYAVKWCRNCIRIGNTGIVCSQ
ncbi:MAG: peptidoglycan-binding protein [Pseudomonadota bacterium]